MRNIDRKIDRLERWLRDIFESPEDVEFSVTSIAPDALVWQGQAPPNDTYLPPPYELSSRVNLPRYQLWAELARKLDEFTDYRNRQIRNQQAIAAVPEWWQVRSPQVPQASLILADLDATSPSGLGRSRWTLNVPHYGHDSTFTPSLEFRKGSHYGSLRLKDNSQIWVNCYSQDEAERVINILQGWVDPQLLPDNPEQTYGKRKGQSLSEKRVKAIRVAYYSVGQANLEPDWVKFL